MGFTFLVWVGAGGVGGGGAGGGGKNVIRIVAMPKPLVFTTLSPLCTPYRGARSVVTSIHAFGDHAKNTGIYNVFASSYNIFRTIFPCALKGPFKVLFWEIFSCGFAMNKMNVTPHE